LNRTAENRLGQKNRAEPKSSPVFANPQPSHINPFQPQMQTDLSSICYQVAHVIVDIGGSSASTSPTPPTPAADGK
jgi:hypothetical protein